MQKSSAYHLPADSLLIQQPGSFYLGDPNRLYLRYIYRVRDKISLGMIAEKDPGEKLFNSRSGFDYCSGHIALETKGVVKKVVTGDFHARFGQGLVLWTGASYSGGSDPSSIKLYPRWITPNTSANESSFLRGGAVTLNWKKFEIIILYSRKSNDANIVYKDSTDTEGHITSMPATGYHRTLNEIQDRNRLIIRHLGSHITYSSERFRAGITFIDSRFSAKMEPEDTPANRFSFRGDRNTVAGMDFDILFRRTNLFGEIAASKNGGWATLAGLSHTSDNGSMFGLLIREYKPAYQNLLAQAPGKRDHNANEKGIRVIMEFPLFKKMSLSVSYDHYTYPWLTHGNSNTRRGQDYQCKVAFSPSARNGLIVKYRYRWISANSDHLKTWFDRITNDIRHEIQVTGRHPISASFSARLQVGYVMAERPAEKVQSRGSLMIFDLFYHPVKLPFRLTFRYALFHTDDYDSRIYTYENDVLHAASMPAYYGEGFRYYILLKYIPARWLDCWLRFSMTCYTDRTSISSGPDEIKGNKLPEIKVQFRLKL